MPKVSKLRIRNSRYSRYSRYSRKFKSNKSKFKSKRLNRKFKSKRLNIKHYGGAESKCSNTISNKILTKEIVIC